MSDSTLKKEQVDEEEMSLKDVVSKINIWWQFVFRSWKIIVFCGVLGGGLGLGYSILKKPVYKAELSFALDDAKGGGALAAYSGVASQFGLDLGGGGGAFSGDNLIELMKSRTMIQSTLLSTVKINGKDETLAQLYIEFNKFRDSWRNKPELAKIDFPPKIDAEKLSLTQDSVLESFHKMLILNSLTVDKVDKKLSIITVTVKAKNELFAKYFTEVLVDKVSQYYIDTKTRKTAKNVRILQRQTDSVRNQLNGAIYNVASSIDDNPNANPSRQVLRATSQHHQVDVQVNSAILTELVKNLEIAKVSLLNETPLIQVIDKPILPLDKSKVGKFIGILVGSILGMIICIVFLSVRRVFQLLMA